MNKSLLTIVFIILGINGLTEAKVGSPCNKTSDCDKDEICAHGGPRKGEVKKVCVSRYSTNASV